METSVFKAVLKPKSYIVSSLYRKMKKRLGSLLASALICSSAVLSSSFNENFESPIVPGPVNGQKGWYSAEPAEVSVEKSFEGSNSLKLFNGSAKHSITNNSVPLWVRFYANLEGKPSEVPVIDNPNTSVAFYVNTNLNIIAYDHTNTVEIQNSHINTNTWNQFDIFCDYNNSTNPSWSLELNGTNLASGLKFYSSNSQLESVLFSNSSSSPTYVDSISLSEIEPEGKLTDSDGDGIANWWEQKYFGGITNCSASDLSMNENFSFLESYIAGLNPFNQDDTFRIIQEGPKKMRWDSKPGREYKVYTTTNLLGGLKYQQTVGETNFFEDSQDTPKKFYQIKVEKK